MSNTNPESGVVQDYNAPDIHDEYTASVQDAINKSHKQREAAKEANRAKVLQAKRRNWWTCLFHWIIYYCGVACIIAVLRLSSVVPVWVAGSLLVLAAAECLFRLKAVIRAYPKK